MLRSSQLLSVKKPPDKIVQKTNIVRVRKNINIDTDKNIKLTNKNTINVNKIMKPVSKSKKTIKSPIDSECNYIENNPGKNMDKIFVKDFKKIDVPDWYNPIISSKFHVPIANSDNSNLYDSYSSYSNYIGFGNETYNDKYIRLYRANNQSEESFINTKFENDDIMQIQKDIALKRRDTALSKCTDDSDKTKSKKQGINTKYENNITKLGKITVCEKYILHLTPKQKEIIHGWIIECNILYNKCVEIHNADNDYFVKGFMDAKLKIFDDVYGDKDKPAPYDMLTDEVRIFCSNLQSCKTNLSRSHIEHYELKPRDIHNYKRRSIFIPKTAIKKDSIYGRHLGKLKIKGIEYLDVDRINSDCRLFYNKVYDYNTCVKR